MYEICLKQHLFRSKMPSLISAFDKAILNQMPETFFYGDFKILCYLDRQGCRKLKIEEPQHGKGWIVGPAS